MGFIDMIPNIIANYIDKVIWDKNSNKIIIVYKDGSLSDKLQKLLINVLRNYGIEVEVYE